MEKDPNITPEQRKQDYEELLESREKEGKELYIHEQSFSSQVGLEIKRASDSLLAAIQQDEATNINEMLETQVKSLHQAYKILTSNALSQKDMDFLKFSLVAQEQCRRTAATHKWINGSATPLPPQNDERTDRYKNAK